LAENFEVGDGKVAGKICSAAGNLSANTVFFCVTEDNHRHSWRSRPVAGPTGCNSTCSQQPGFHGSKT